MFGIGMPELILILAVALMVIGPKKLPDLAKSLGRAMREFKKATSELKDSMELDGEVRDVKDTFDDIRSDIKGSVLEDKPTAGSETNLDWEKSAPDHAAEDRSFDAGVDEASGDDSIPKPLEAESSPPDDTPEKDR